jgi:hypothetical protein
MNLKDKLLELEEVIKGYKPLLMNAVNEGLSNLVIKEKLKGITSNLSNDIITLYEWKNGINGDAVEADELFVDCFFLTIDSALDYCEWESMEIWKGRFFPLFMGYGGVLTLIGLEESKSDFNKIFFYDPTSGGTNATHGKQLISYCDSLLSLIVSVIQCYQEGVYKYNNEIEEFVIDWDLLHDIHKRNNPNSEYWHPAR